MVGNGPNKVAAEEVRIKLSELCYKSIACDVTEDKKHIDLSSEPLILVCAAGLSGSTADDVGKEIAIFRAHKATPIVVVDEGDQRYDAAALITVPPVDPALGFVLSAMVGHLFGYEAALAIDTSARPLRQAREAIETLVGESSDGDEVLARLPAMVRPSVDRYLDGLRSGRYNGHLEASTAVRLIGLFRNVLSARPLEDYQFDSGKVATPGNLIDDLSMRSPAPSKSSPVRSTPSSIRRRPSRSASPAATRECSIGRWCRRCSTPELDAMRSRIAR